MRVVQGRAGRDGDGVTIDPLDRSGPRMTGDGLWPIRRMSRKELLKFYARPSFWYRLCRACSAFVREIKGSVIHMERPL